MNSIVLKILFFVTSIGLSSPLWAQTSPQETSRSYFDIGIKTGTFLPSRIQGVRELLPIFGVKIGHSVSPTMGLEYDVDVANAKGVTYMNAYFSLRHDFVVGDVIPLFFLLGVDFHKYRTADAYGSITNTIVTEGEDRTATGWHVGFGSETLIYGDIWFRSDIRMGFSPGRQLTVALAGIYRF